MSIAKPSILRTAAFAAMVFFGLYDHAQAQLACTVTATGVTGIYTVSSALDLQGQFVVNCSRPDTNTSAGPYRLYLGINQGETAVTGRNMLRQQTTNNAANRLAYSIFRNSTPSGSWTEGNGQASGNNTGGLLHTFSFSGSTLSYSQIFPYYFRVAANIPGKVAGIYDDEQVRIQVRNVATTGNVTGTSGTQLATALFTTNASILSRCYFSITPTPLNMSYVAFAPTPSTGSNNFSVNCTLSTPYTMALSSTSGVLVGLNYSLALSATSSVGTGFAENFNVVGTIAAGQAGTCATSSCSATSAPQTITITY
jgi:spore coat protein U-like protein